MTTETKHTRAHMNSYHALLRDMAETAQIEASRASGQELKDLLLVWVEECVRMRKRLRDLLPHLDKHIGEQAKGEDYDILFPAMGIDGYCRGCGRELQAED